MVPFIPDPLPDLSEKKLLILSGQYNPIISKKQAEDLFSLLKSAGTKEEIKWQTSGQEIT
jgi:predicted esterase